jgi:hypothetical protein
MVSSIDRIARCEQNSRALRIFRRALLVSSVALAVTPATSLAQTYTFTNHGAIQTWIVPQSGKYSVTATGAQGASAQTGFAGGRGAQVTDSFNFTQGQSYQIAVGGAGHSDGCNGGGGGGTFFVNSTNTPWLVAGGGGGTREGAGQNGTDASITQFGTTASGGSPTYTPTVKSTDLGLGGIVSSGTWGSGGAGFFGNGASDVPWVARRLVAVPGLTEWEGAPVQHTAALAAVAPEMVPVVAVVAAAIQAATAAGSRAVAALTLLM